MGSAEAWGLELNGAASLIVCYNRPSSNAEPSQADTGLTRVSFDLLELVEMRLIVHVVVSSNDTGIAVVVGFAVSTNPILVALLGPLFGINARQIFWDKGYVQVCPKVTGKRPMTGNNVSHAMNKTRRRFLPNLHTHRFWVEAEKRYRRSCACHPAGCAHHRQEGHRRGVKGRSRCRPQGLTATLCKAFVAKYRELNHAR